jgi:copper chaperone CopZ
MSTVSTLKVTGMTCEHCVRAVTTELSALPGVTSVQVDLQVGALTPVTVISDTELDPTAVAAAIDEAGYQLADA